MTRRAERTLVVLQPGYLPWLGFFDQVRRADVFVYYDDVQFDTHGWRNRNRVKSPRGAHWLSVPVRHAWPNLIADVEVDNRQPWARKHIGTLQQFYARAPHTPEYLPTLEALLSQPWQRLVDLDIALSEQLCQWLGISTPRLRASELGVPGSRSQRLIDMCVHFGATRYLSGDAASAYLDVELFNRAGIAVEWQHFVHPEYPQQFGAFVPYLSVVDLLFNCGADSHAILSRSPALQVFA